MADHGWRGLLPQAPLDEPRPCVECTDVPRREEQRDEEDIEQHRIALRLERKVVP